MYIDKYQCKEQIVPMVQNTNKKKTMHPTPIYALKTYRCRTFEYNTCTLIFLKKGNYCVLVSARGLGTAVAFVFWCSSSRRDDSWLCSTLDFTALNMLDNSLVAVSSASAEYY